MLLSIAKRLVIFRVDTNSLDHFNHIKEPQIMADASQPKLNPENIKDSKAYDELSNEQKTTKTTKLHANITNTLGAGDLRLAVLKPKGEDLHEWIAVNTVDFFKEISLLYGIISEYCTKQSCPSMCAGLKYHYLWIDGVKYKKPFKCSAPEYVDLLMSWIEKQINDPRIFPVEAGIQFPKDFEQIIKKILRRLFRVYAHIYQHHIVKFIQLDAEAHLNTSFKHFIYFVKHFKLVSDQDLAPLSNTIEQMLLRDAQRKRKQRYKPKYQYKK